MMRELAVDMGVPVAAAVDGDGHVVSGVLPAGRYAALTHAGHPGERRAVTKALLQSGVSYVTGYQGAPISHLVDVPAAANHILQTLVVSFAARAIYVAAPPALAASINYPSRARSSRTVSMSDQQELGRRERP